MARGVREKGSEVRCGPLAASRTDGAQVKSSFRADATDKKLLDDLRSRIEALEASSCDQHDFDSTGTVQEVTSLSSLYPEGTLIDLEKLVSHCSRSIDREARADATLRR